MKNKQTQETLLSQIKGGKLFNKKMSLTIEHLFKENHSKISRSKIKTTIDDLNKQGKLLIKDNKIVPFDNFLVGVFSSKKFGGYITVKEDGVAKQYPVSSSDFKKIPHNTTVGFTVKQYGEREFAHISSIVSFSDNSLFGHVKKTKKGNLIFVPDFNPFEASFVLEENSFATSAVGKKVKVKIKSISNSRDRFDVVIENEGNIFGPMFSPLANIQSVLIEEGVPQSFPAKVVAEALKIPTSVQEHELVGRKDYRNENFVSVDPATAKDMDDATNIKKVINKNGEVEYIYRIAIADISHYVQEGSELDKEAAKRSFSIYAAGGVTPMLPKSLSDDMCSLVEGQDRLVIVSEITYDNLGNVKDYSFHNAVINNKKKMSYELVQNYKDGIYKFDENEKHIEQQLDLMYELTSKIEKIDEKRGVISLAGYQPTVILTPEKDDVEDILNLNSLDSTILVEKAMIATNVAVASFFKTLGVPFLSRMHEAPIESRFEDFTNFLSGLGLDVGFTSATSKAYLDISKLIDGHYLEKIISSRLVRSMQKAKYTSSPDASHFALAEENYTHFTAGIRRYIDITVHRTLKQILELYNSAVEKGLLDKNLSMSKNAEMFARMYQNQLSGIVNTIRLDELALHINKQEELVNKVEARTLALCAALYMRKNLGQNFSGYVSSMEKDKVIVTLKDVSDPRHSDIIDVILPIDNLLKSKTLTYDQKTETLRLSSTGELAYYDGKKVDLTIEDIDLVEGKIFAKDSLIKMFENTSNKTQNQKTAFKGKPNNTKQPDLNF